MCTAVRSPLNKKRRPGQWPRAALGSALGGAEYLGQSQASWRLTRAGVIGSSRKRLPVS